MSGSRRSARDYFPASFDLSSMRRAATDCHGCDLYIRATRTVFGSGDPHASVMVVGEQPGDAEDIAGEPFVGPAGKLLDHVLEDVHMDRSGVWMTNAVKHFKFEQRGSKRMHVKPTMLEVTACRPWLDAEITIVEPDVVVLLGATAAQSLLGTDFRITHHRGEWLEWDRPPRVMATWHPSAVLRAQTHEDRVRMRHELTTDLRKVARRLARV